MCQSKAEGGKRCEHQSLASQSQSSLQKSIQYYSQQKDSQSVQRLKTSKIALAEAKEKYGDFVMHHNMSISDDVNNLLSTLRSSNWNPLIVGGCVRDSVLNPKIAPKDIDIEIYDVDNIDDVISYLKQNNYVVNEVGKSFGVLKTCLPDNTDIDISLPRKDNKTGSSHRDFEIEVDPDLSLTDAAARRDFTLNALYYDHSLNAVIDPHGGVEDLRSRRLHRIGEAFKEDPLRVLRGVQLASRFGLSMSEVTIEDSRSIRDQFSNLSDERIQEEWAKFMNKSTSVENGFQVLHSTNWSSLMHVNSVQSSEQYQSIDRVRQNAKAQHLPVDVYGTAAVMSHVPAESHDNFLNQTLNDKRKRRMVKSLVQEKIPEIKTRQDIKVWARHLDQKGLTVSRWMSLHRYTDVSKTRARQVLDLSRKNNVLHGLLSDHVNGEMILAEANADRGGKWVGHLLRKAQQAQDAGIIINESSGREWVKNQLELLRN